MEDVDGIDGVLPLLLEAEHEVDPCGQPDRRERRLERLAVNEHEEAGVAAAPRRQRHVPHLLPALTPPEVEPCNTQANNGRGTAGNACSFVPSFKLDPSDKRRAVHRAIVVQMTNKLTQKEFNTSFCQVHFKPIDTDNSSHNLLF